jgi:hypothetical protein
MAIYTLPALKSRITARIFSNNAHLIDAETVRDLMHDIMDSLEAAIGEVSAPPVTSDSQKIYHQASVSGSLTIDIAAYAPKFYIDRVILTKKSGSPTTIRIGFSEFASEVLTSTDISDLITDTPTPITTGTIPKTGQNTMYLAFAGTGVFDLDVVLTRYKE